MSRREGGFTALIDSNSSPKPNTRFSIYTFLNLVLLSSSSSCPFAGFDVLDLGGKNEGSLKGGGVGERVAWRGRGCRCCFFVGRGWRGFVFVGILGFASSDSESDLESEESESESDSDSESEDEDEDTEEEEDDDEDDAEDEEEAEDDPDGPGPSTSIPSTSSSLTPFETLTTSSASSDEDEEDDEAVS